jgi:hypothetical protein
MKKGTMVKFRFQDLKIWHSAIEIANELFDIADDLEMRKLISQDQCNELLNKLDILCRQISNFRKSLKY